MGAIYTESTVLSSMLLEINFVQMLLLRNGEFCNDYITKRTGFAQLNKCVMTAF
jgi:hypothetical protein